MMPRRSQARWLALIASLPLVGAHAQSSDGTLDGMTLDQLLNQRSALYDDSQTTSTIKETVRDAPGTLVVVDAQEIERRGYDSLEELVADLPGFDTIITNGTQQVVTYQRGYRTPWTQRTLLLVNGRVDNHLWNHAAQFSRQYPMQIIDRVEVLYGPSGAVYGPNAFLGVINIITRKGAQLSADSNQLTASINMGSYQSRSVDLAWLGNYSDISWSLGARLFSSDEAPIEDYSAWGYTEQRWLADPGTWGAGIGAGLDPATGNVSPSGDINVDGQVSDAELMNGAPLGRYQDPSDNRGIYAEVEGSVWLLGASYWQTEEGYGPYYSFADSQPNALWVHESTQLFGRYQDQWSDRWQGRTDLVYRESRVGGDWVESFAGDVSLSTWNNFNSAWRLEQSLTYRASERTTWSAGIKYERKTLAKLYMICNYFNGTGVCPAQAANSIDGRTSDGSGIRAADSISSDNPSPLPPSLADRQIPKHNRAETTDTGIYTQWRYDLGQWRFNAGLRWDQNSDYGSDVNPRLAAIFHYRTDTTFKLVYGEAFQEPSPKELYGEFSGRPANERLIPEKAHNLEAIGIYQGALALHETSLFLAHYENAIAGAQNVGQRRIYGLEYRASARFKNPFTQYSPLTAKVFYTFTRARAEQQYDPLAGDWITRWDDQGDIAPHKITAIVNLPLSEHWNINVRGHWRSARKLFSENPLRTQGIKAKAYSQFDATLLYRHSAWQLGLKVRNVLGADYLQPGVESAASGNDFDTDHDGFQNSLIPQVNRPVVSLHVRAVF